MANVDQVAIIREGEYRWNEWRRENPDAAIDLVEVNLADINLGGFSHVNLRQANLQGADLNHANLSRADLSAANLREANLHFANLEGAELFDADFSGARLTWANLSRAHFTITKLNGAILGYSTIANVGFKGCIGLEAVHHEGPSSVGIDTLQRSSEELPDIFLRGCGVPEKFIACARSLVGLPIQFHSSFISYSSKDQDFADRVYADLQAKGVRCWFAPEDLKIGDKFRSRIDESIRVFDKLLLVLSQHSIASPWVEDEVEAALERERRESRPVLFPIRLDDAIMQTDVAWAAHLRHKRHIGHFCDWKRHDAYQKAFGRPLRDLQADAAAEAEKGRG